MSSSELTELQQTLYSSRNPTRRWLHNDRLERVSAEIRAAAERGATARALEVGPGAGPYVGLLCELFDEVVASDIEAQHLAYLEGEQAAQPELANLTLRTDDIVASALEPGSFDLILCSEVIEHIPDPAAVLAGIVRLLRPGGTLVLSTPQPYSPIELLGRVAFWPGIIQIVRAIYREPILPTGHISLVGRERLRGLIEGSGLRIRSSALGGLYVPVLAEAGGQRALRVEQRLASRLQRRGGALAGLLWTQYWTAERPA